MPLKYVLFQLSFPLTRYELVTSVDFKKCDSKAATCAKLICPKSKISQLAALIGQDASEKVDDLAHFFIKSINLITPLKVNLFFKFRYAEMKIRHEAQINILTHKFFSSYHIQTCKHFHLSHKLAHFRKFHSLLRLLLIHYQWYWTEYLIVATK